MLGHCVDMQYSVSFLSFAIILLEKRERERELVALFLLSFWCLLAAIVPLPFLHGVCSLWLWGFLDIHTFYGIDEYLSLACTWIKEINAMGEHDLKVFIQMLCTIWNVKTVLSLQPTKMAFYHYLRHRRSISILFLSQNPFIKQWC